jgi:DNA polymerase-3 subunit delta
VKASRAQLERALDTAPESVRLFLLYGPDEASSRDLATRLGKAMGADAERIDLTGATLKADPARLSDEAAAISLFGGRRHIRVDGAGDEIIGAVEALIDAPAAGNPVAIVAGALRKDSKLLKLALAHPAAMAFVSYLPEGADADRLVVAIGREAGLQMRPDVAHRIAVAAAGDRALITREIEKLALFVDAAPDRPGELDHAALDALSAEGEEGDLSRLVDAVLGGKPDAAGAELASLVSDGVDAIPILRAMLRRLHVLVELRSAVADGNGVEAVLERAGKALFWKDKAAISRQVSTWRPEALQTALERLAAAEREVKRSGGAGLVAVQEELLAISRAAQRMR